MKPAKPAGPCVLVIFGAGGDLTKRLLVPALYNLRREKLLPEEFAIVGVARSRQEDETFRQELGASLHEYAQGKIVECDWSWLAERMFYIQGDFDDPAVYQRLAEHLTKIDQTNRTGGNYLFYLATPPQVFATIVQRLSETGLSAEAEGHWRRIIIEKPFGTDLRSAQELNREILAVATESQIYRIDHYLGKETVQNIMVFRFGNGIFEPLWNRNHIDHVQITVAEAVGVEGRGKFYESTGALRDMVPNHLFQLLTLVAMEPPTCFDAEAVRSEKAKVLQAVQRYSPQDARQNVVRGQYGGGKVNGRDVDPYRACPECRARTRTPRPSWP